MSFVLDLTLRMSNFINSMMNLLLERLIVNSVNFSSCKTRVSFTNLYPGDRPAFGTPDLATLQVGGNDIDFPGIIFNCILEYNFPFGAGPTYRTCPDQRKFSQDLIKDPKLVENISNTIKKVVDRGRKGPIGEKFRLYVPGFPQFFDVTSKDCDTVTFARGANPKSDGKEHIKMTQAIRQEYNDMSVGLNKAIAAAVEKHKDENVKFVPIDGQLKGHRYCEPGVKEPDQKNEKLWIWHYPYNEPDDKSFDDRLSKAYQTVNSRANVQSEFPTYASFQIEVFANIDNGGSDATGIQDPLWRYIGNRVKVFHPQNALHEKIRDLVLDQYTDDLGGLTTPPTPPPTVPDKNACHGISGDTWVMHADTATKNVDDFCGQTAKEVTYNQGSVDELKLSVTAPNNQDKGAKDAPSCAASFKDAVINGCDGGDSLNNPHNYKFGGTLTTGDGWQYTLTPLSKQINEVSCDVSYKFLWDSFEIRGKNLPDAKLGAEGEGLKKQLDGCGAVTQYKFERTPDDAKFQWYASGRLPIGTKACVGSALETAGGSGNGNCHGAGKRGVGRSEIGIEDWPGYGDDSKHVFASDIKRDIGIEDWPGYGDDSKHVFGVSG